MRRKPRSIVQSDFYVISPFTILVEIMSATIHCEIRSEVLHRSSIEEENLIYKKPRDESLRSSYNPTIFEFYTVGTVLDNAGTTDRAY